VIPESEILPIERYAAMSSDRPNPVVAPTRAPLSETLDRSEHVLDKVEEAAVELSSVNATLKDELGEGVALDKVEDALTQSEAVEVKVQEAAAELVAVNDALAEEVDERHRLEQQLSNSDAALTRSRAALRRASDSALHDALTGLANLTLFNDRLGVALAQAERHSWRLAVMFIDLDGFKLVNDTHGHAAGDRVLVTMAERLKAAVRMGDTVSRRSGDEFLFLMLEAKDDANVMALASRIATALAQPCDVEGKSLRVGASVGIALYPEDGRSAAELLQHADAAMYVAKQNGAGPVLYRRIEPVAGRLPGAG
jgi:diguanylate cyclase (GGDEF)-like protein